MSSTVRDQTASLPPGDIPPPPPHESFRLLLLAVILLVALVAAYVTFNTPLGHKLRDKDLVRTWVAHHRAITPLIIVTVYVMFAVLLLPVWEIQMLAGYCFGLYAGIVWCELGAAIGGCVSLVLSRWLVGQWFQSRYEARMARLHAVNEKLGHNGLLVVMGVRLCHVLPFGISNYLFGLTRITVVDVFIGTLSGGLVAIAFYVTLGADAALLKTFKFWGALSAVNLVLLIPLALRYLWPRWFKKIGVE